MSAYNKIGDLIASIGNAVDVSSIKSLYPAYNDDQILDAAIAEAVKIGKTAVIIWDGKDIHFSGETIHECKGFGGINFGGSKIYMPDHDHPYSNEYADSIIRIVPDEAENLTVPYTDIADTYTSNANLMGKSFTIGKAISGNADMCLGNRTPVESFPNTVIYSAPTVLTATDGIYETGPLYLSPKSGTVNIYNAHTVPDITFYISNATIITNSGENMSNFIWCERSNVRISNIVLTGTSQTRAFHPGVISFWNCCNVEIDHITGDNPIRKALTSGYAFGLYSVSYAYIHDVKIGNVSSWGAMGSRYLTNTVTERCFLNRWDCHFAQFGYNLIKDSVLNLIAHGIGSGDISISNCTIIQEDGANTLILLRQDCPGVFDGNISVKNCEFVKTSGDSVPLTIWSDGCIYEKQTNSKAPGGAKHTRKIEGCTVPDCTNIIKAGHTFSSGLNDYENIVYIFANQNLPRVDSAITAYNQNQAVKSVNVEYCTTESGIYVTKAFPKVPIRIANCDFSGQTIKIDKNDNTIIVIGSNINSLSVDTASNDLIMTGNVITEQQTVDKFTRYSLSGNLGVDMGTVNKWSVSY